MKRITWMLALLSVFLALPVVAQTTSPNRIGAGGMGYFSQSTPQFQGWGALGLPITSDNKTLSYTVFDVGIVKSGGELMVGGLQLQYSMRTGIAYQVYQRGSWSLYGLAAPGFAATGTNFAAAFEYGGFLHKIVYNNNVGIILGLTQERYGNITDLAPRLGISIKF